jgi:hypothetical protein
VIYSNLFLASAIEAGTTTGPHPTGRAGNSTGAVRWSHRLHLRSHRLHLRSHRWHVRSHRWHLRKTNRLSSCPHACRKAQMTAWRRNVDVLVLSGRESSRQRTGPTQQLIEMRAKFKRHVNRYHDRSWKNPDQTLLARKRRASHPPAAVPMGHDVAIGHTTSVEKLRSPLQRPRHETSSDERGSPIMWSPMAVPITSAVRPKYAS